MRRTPSSASVRFVLAMVVMCAALLAFPALAHAAPNSISGTVTDEVNGAPVPVIYVYLYSYDGGAWNYVNSTTTDADGAYEFAGLASGDSYGVGFFDWKYSAYLDQYWNAKGTQGEADFITVTDGAVTAGIDAALVKNTAGADTGTISGRVTCVETGWPLPGTTVHLWAYDGAGDTWYEWWYAAQAGSDGQYLFTGLPAGDYKLSFSPSSPYLPEYYHNKGNVWGADGASLAEDGDVQDIDEQLNLVPSAIAGAVVHQTSGDPLENVAVRRYDWDGSSFNDSGVDAWTDVNGHFAFGGLPANDYKLFVYDPWWPRTYLDEWFEDAAYDSDATVITLDGSNVSIDTVAELALAGRLGGQVTAEDTGDPLSSVYVELYNYDADSDSWSWLNSAYTDGSGRYEFNGLAHGEYKLHFRDEGAHAYVSEYYNDVHSGRVDATVIPIGETPVLDADAALTFGASVSGTVVREVGGTPIQSAQVTAYYYENGIWTAGSGYYAYTDSSGEFTLGGLPLGTYRFQASYGFYLPEYWQESSTVQGGTSIVLTATTTEPGVDFTLAEYPTISGRATNLSGTGLYGIYVSVFEQRFNSDGSTYWSSTGSSANTDSNGYYTINYLMPGTYRVRFYDNYGDGTNYLTEYYPDQPTVWAAADITVSPGDDVTSVDVHMSTGNTISGTVYDSGSTPLSGVLVRAFAYNDGDNDWERVGNDAYTNGSGAYTLTGLSDGTYRLGYYLNGYAIEYYDNDANAFDAQSIVAPDGSPIAGVDMHLDLTGAQTPATVSGAVTADTGGAGIQGVQVVAYRSDPMLNGGWYWANSTNTNAAGAYSMGVPPGLYRFRFNDYDYTYVSEYYNDTSSVSSAALVTVAPGATVTVNAGLATGGAISGTITDAETHAPLGSVTAYVYYQTDDNWYFVSSDTSDENGHYRAGAMATGEYRIQFVDTAGIYRPEYYDNTQYSSEAAAIPVTIGDETAGIDADLDRYGAIRGVVRSDDRQGIDGIYVMVYQRYADYWNFYTSATTMNDGRFDFAQLAPGQYIVRCQDDGGYGFQRYLGEYYLDATRSDQATVLEVTNTTHEITITLDSTGTWGDISGVVTDAGTSDPIEGMPVCLYEDDGAGGWTFFGRYTATLQDGSYWLQWVPAGEYRILADPTYDAGSGTPWNDVYTPTYHLDAAAVGNADPVTVTAGAETSSTDVHVAVRPGVGYLGGTLIEDGTEIPVPNATVTMWSAAGGDRQVYAYDWTDDLGHFKRPVPEGPYVLEFADGPRHRAEFYQDVMTANPWDADVLDVVAPASTEVTASLEPLGSIVGTVTDEVTHEPIAGIEADAYIPNASGGLDYAGGVMTGADGRYELIGVPYGPCRVWFYDAVAQRYVSEAYNNKPDPNRGDNVIVGAVPTTVNVELTPAASISGTVTDAITHAPVPNVYVMYYVYDAGNFVWDGMWGDYTDANGTYTLPVMPAGTYRIRFSDGSKNYAEEYWNDAWDIELADDIVLAVGEDRTGIDASLVEGGTIAGTVTDVISTGPLSSAHVYAYQWSERYQDWEFARSASTNASGQYTLAGLRPMPTRLYFNRSGYLNEYHENKRDVWAGDEVDVTVGGTHVVDAALLQWPGTSISGHVTNAGGSPLSSVYVVALRYDGRHGVYVQERSDYTDGSGNYQIDYLNDGLYRIEFWHSGGGMQREYYNDQPTVELAEDVEIANGQPVTGINATLSPYTSPPTGTVSGTVLSDATGLPIEGIAVRIGYYAPAASQWQFSEYAHTAADGTYSFEAPVGTARLFFYDATGTYVSEYFHNATNVWSGSDVIVVEAATTTVNENLATAGHITGTVTAAAGGAPLQDISTYLYRYAAGQWNYVDTGYTGADGTYDVGGLEPGVYRVEFSDGMGVYRGEYYDNVHDMSDATNIALSAGETRGGIDAQLDTLGVIRGTVTDEATGRPVEQLRVWLWRDDGGGAYRWTWTMTDSFGQYRFGGLNPTTCLVQFADEDPPVGFQRFVGEFYDDQPDDASATRLVVTTQEIVADAQLASTGTWGSIEGTVTDGVSGHPLANMPVGLYYYDGGSWAQTWAMAYTDAAGGYRFPYVPEQAGQAPYRVGTPIAGAPPLSTYYQETFHLDATDVDSADDVALVANRHLTGVDIHMVRQPGIGWLSGTVEAEGTNEPLGGITVELYRASSGNYVGAATTLDDGTYGFPVSADSYAVYVYDSTGAYAAEWFDNRIFWWQADPIAVADGGSATADVSLARSASITGSVRNSSGEPLETWVYVYDASTWNSIRNAYSSGGDYAFEGLQPGDYYVQFSSTGPYRDEYWNDRMSAPDTIVLGPGETSSSIDATLTIGGTISGTVTSDDGALAADVTVVFYREEALGWTWVSGTTAYGYNNWDFTSDPLLPGTYRICYYDQWSQYATLYYDGVITLDPGAEVAVDEGATTPVTLRLDGLPPEVGSDVVSDYDTSASIEVTATDAVTGVDSILYALDGGDVATVPGSTATTDVVGWGDHTIEYWAQDLLGQQCDPVLAEFFIHDVTDPTVDSDAQASYPTTATITLIAQDEANGSGLAGISYVVDGDENTKTVDAATAEVEVGGVGDHSLEYWATDNEGNESAHETDNFTIADVDDPTAADDAVATYVGTAVIHLIADDNVAVDHISWRLNCGAWTDVPGDSATVTVTTVGPHTLQYQAFDTSDNSSPVYSASFTVTRADGVTQTQIAGTNRYTTSVEISKVAFPAGSEWVIVATGNNWPDALGGSALAGALNAPILLTNTNAMPAEVTAEIRRLGADRAIILGGTAAVGKPVESALKTMLGASDVERLAGSNRYQTAELVGARTIDELGASFDGTAFVATGANYPDALGAAPLAAGLGWPLFLTKPTGLDPSTFAAMAGTSHVLVLGGTAVVSPAIEASLDARYGGANVDRLAGGNRYETAVAVATYGVAHGLGWNRVAIATGQAFPDALAGGVLQGRSGSVMLLTPSGSLNTSVATALAAHKSVIAEVRYLGGLNAVTQTVRTAVTAALN